MYALAKFMGGYGKPVQEAVAKVLEQNEGYELVLTGHSLGAGVCSILALVCSRYGKIANIVANSCLT